MGGEIVTLHLGQAGVQISHALWELVCVEHGISAGGRRILEAVNLDEHETGREFVFREVLHNKFVPRALLIDLEPTVIDEIRTGAYRDLWHPMQLISGKEDAASNFARGYYSQSRFEMNDVMDRIRILVEQCDNMACFKLLYSANGGTGSGLTSALCERLSDEYGKKHKFATTVYPSPGYSELMVEPYNALLHSSTNLTFCDCVVITDNEAMLNLVEDSLRLHHAGFTVPNRVIANAITTQFLSHRYKFIGQQHSHVDELLINLIPYPRIHFPMMAFAPFFGPACHDFEKSSAVDLVRSVFEDSNQLLSVSAVRRAYISCALLFRGSTTPLEAINAISAIKADRLSRARFVDWCPTGFKIGVNFAAPVQAPTANTVSLKNSSLSMIAGNLSIRDVWTGIGRRFDHLYERRAYVHWYVAEGMEEGEFTLAREVIQQLVEDYEAIAKDAEGALDETSVNQSQNQMTKSAVRVTPAMHRSPRNRTEPNMNQATTLDEQNSLRTLDNNEEQLSLDTNQHHFESVLADGYRYNRVRRGGNGGNGRNEWETGTAPQRGPPGSRISSTNRPRLRFPEYSQQSYLSSSVDRFAGTTSALMESAVQPSIYGTNCSAAVLRNPLHHNTLMQKTKSNKLPTKQTPHPKHLHHRTRSESTKLGRGHCTKTTCPASQHDKKRSGIPRLSRKLYADDIFRKCDFQHGEHSRIHDSIDESAQLIHHRTDQICQPNQRRDSCRSGRTNHREYENHEASDGQSIYSTRSVNSVQLSSEQSCPHKTLSNVHGTSESNLSCDSVESIPDVRNNHARSDSAFFICPTVPNFRQSPTSCSEKMSSITLQSLISQARECQTVKNAQCNYSSWKLKSPSRPHSQNAKINQKTCSKLGTAGNSGRENNPSTQDLTERTDLSDSTKLRSPIQSLQSVSLEACEVRVQETSPQHSPNCLEPNLAKHSIQTRERLVERLPKTMSCPCSSADTVLGKSKDLYDTMQTWPYTSCASEQYNCVDNPMSSEKQCANPKEANGSPISGCSASHHSATILNVGNSLQSVLEISNETIIQL